MENNDHKYFRTVMDAHMRENSHNIMFDVGFDCDSCPHMNDEFTVYLCEGCRVTKIV